MKNIKIIKIQDGIVTAKILDEVSPIQASSSDNSIVIYRVIHAHWEDCSNGWMCSNCQRGSSHDTRYCPHCGAKMDEVINDD